MSDNEAAALDAITRLDAGAELPGDRALADAYDRRCQVAHDRRIERDMQQAEADFRDYWRAAFGQEWGGM